MSKKNVLKLLFCCAVIGNLPDLDIAGVILFPQFASFIHRSVGHNIFALALWIIVGRWMLSRVARLQFDSVRSYLYSFSLVASHVLLDSACLDKPGVPAGVPLLWPFSEWKFESPFALFTDYQLELNHNWFMGHLLASDYWTRAVLNEVFVTGVLVALFVGCDRLINLTSARLETQSIKSVNRVKQGTIEVRDFPERSDARLPQ